MACSPAERPSFVRLLLLRGAFAASALAGALAVPGASEPPSASGGKSRAWVVGRPVAVKADGGLSRFSVPTPNAGARTLVIVSTLARSPGPFPVRLTARGVDPGSCRPPETADEGPRRPTRLRTGPQPCPSDPPKTSPPVERTFHLMVHDGDVASGSNYLAVRGVLRAVGKRVQVYVDSADLAAVQPGTLTDLIATFDERVFPVASRTFGEARDVDGDGRFTVLMSGWLTRLAGGRHAVDGFVRGADFSTGLPEPFSNHCDMMYLSTSLKPGPHLRTVVAHEYTHAVSFCARSFPPVAGRGPAPEEEGWLDEAAAHLVEDLHGFSRSNLDFRVSAFLSQPERYRLVVDDYYAADLFRSHGNRGATYLFLRWCADAFGPALLPTLIASETRGLENLETATGRSFPDLYRDWSVALFSAGFAPEARPAVADSLQTRGPFGGWDLAGPRTTAVTPGAEPSSWWSAGTASKFFVVESSPTGAVEVEVATSAEAGLQVTATSLPDDLACLELRAEVVPERGGEPAVVATLRESNGTPLTLTSLSWEPLVPATNPHAPGFRRAGLDTGAIRSACGTAGLAARGRLEIGPVPAGAGFSPHTPVVVKAVGIDARGRRVSAWAELKPTDRPTPAVARGRSSQLP